MRIISTTAHGVLDYLMGITLVSSPWLFGFYLNGAESWAPVAVGSALIIYSLFTNYEFGAFKQISMNAHLSLDMLSGVFLAASPWIFNFDQVVYTPHLWLGISMVVFVLITDQIPYQKVSKVEIKQPGLSNMPVSEKPAAAKAKEEGQRGQQRKS
jgi:hypothetical protein